MCQRKPTGLLALYHACHHSLQQITSPKPCPVRLVVTFTRGNGSNGGQGQAIDDPGKPFDTLQHNMAESWGSIHADSC